jgi:DNA-binding transcriptional ArsR family regulator|tara:strand:- start:53529 stop:53903 length:375 start_codon:yes stop_codon:yes gene_type:complete
MDVHDANRVFNALSQETRLRAFRLLVRAGPTGLAAGALSEALGTPHNTLSFHLNHLSQAGIVSSRREGRSIIYSADFQATHELITFLVRDCCSAEFATVREDSTSACAIIELAQCCAPPSSDRL